MNYSILLVEDSEEDVQTCQTTVERMNDADGELSLSIDSARTIDEAYCKLKSNNYHGAIIDIKIDDGSGKSGNDVVEEIIKTYRLPVAIFTGTPDVKTDDKNRIPVYTKGEKKYDDIINELIEIDNTGLFNVLGGKGLIEKEMTSVFWENIYTLRSTWMKYKQEGIETEPILLRYTLAHLLEYLDTEGPQYCTEEMYIIYPKDDKKYHTGMIVEKECKSYIVLSPPCDLADRIDRTTKTTVQNTDTITLCEIEDIHTACPNTGKLQDFIENKKQNYHWLPDNTLFRGGCINFRKASSVPLKGFLDLFTYNGVKVQDVVVKNILNRFSAYYARQGQPDFNFEVEGQRQKEIFKAI